MLPILRFILPPPTTLISQKFEMKSESVRTLIRSLEWSGIAFSFIDASLEIHQIAMFGYVRASISFRVAVTFAQ